MTTEEAVKKRITEVSNDVRIVSNRIALAHTYNERAALENLRQLLLITYLALRSAK